MAQLGKPADIKFEIAVQSIGKFCAFVFMYSGNTSNSSFPA